MKIIVFGFSGQLGSILKKKETHNFDLILTPHKSFDMLKKGSIGNFIIEQNPDVVLNLAAYTDVDGCENNENEAFLMNSEIPEVISKACYQIDALLIHLSTDYIYNDSSSLPIKEDSIIDPQSIYGKSKYLGEKNIIKNCSKYIILRSSWIYSDIGKNFYITIKKLLECNKTINVVNDQYGAPTLAYDLVNKILKIINFMENKRNCGASLEKFYGTYNISNKGSTTWFKFATLIAKSLSYNSDIRIIPITTEDFAAIAKRPFNSRLDNTKIFNMFGISMPHWKNSFSTFLNMK